MRFLAEILDLFLPKTCIACYRVTGQSFCGSCRQKIILKPITEKRTLYTLHSPFPYTNTLKKLIHTIKFEEFSELLPDLGKIFTDGLAQLAIPHTSIFIPVPSHQKRVQKRGFDTVISLCNSAGLAMNTTCITREKETKALFELSQIQRTNELDKAFIVQDKHAIEGKDVWIVDDIHTSGATLNEISKTVLTAGARSVNAITLAYVA
jgi:ComF family protein